MRWRTIATVIGMPLALAVYALIVMSLMAQVPRFWLTDTVMAAVLGLIWIWPAKHWLFWARRDDV